MFVFGGSLQYLTGTKAWLIIHGLHSVSKVAAFFSSVCKGWASGWLLLEFKYSCAATLSERRSKVESLISAFISVDAGKPVILMGFVDEPFTIRSNSA